MQVEFHGEPSLAARGDGIAVAARADGQPFVCVISRQALDEAARTLRLGVSGHPSVFRQFRHRFRIALAAKLAAMRLVPPEALITSDDVRRVN